MQDANSIFKTLVRDIETCSVLESTKIVSSSKSKRDSNSEIELDDILSAVRSTVEHCDTSRKRDSSDAKVDASDACIVKYAKFTDNMALKPFETFLQYVPRLVNVVTVRNCTSTLSHLSFALTLSCIDFMLLLAVGRSIPSTWKRRNAPPRLELHCESVHWCLLCSKTLFGSAVGVHESEGESANLPYVPHTQSLYGTN